MNDNKPIDGQVSLLEMPDVFRRPEWMVEEESDISTRARDGAAAISFVSEIHNFDGMDADGALESETACVYLVQDIFITMDAIEAHRPMLNICVEGQPYFTADQGREFARKILELADMLDAK